MELLVGRITEAYFFIGTSFGADADLYLSSGKFQIHESIFY